MVPPISEVRFSGNNEADELEISQTNKEEKISRREENSAKDNITPKKKKKTVVVQSLEQIDCESTLPASEVKTADNDEAAPKKRKRKNPANKTTEETDSMTVEYCVACMSCMSISSVTNLCIMFSHF